MCTKISIQINKDMIKLLQKQNGAVFYASQCISSMTRNTMSLIISIINHDKQQRLWWIIQK